MTGPRTFIIRVSESPSRVVIEDVRGRRRAVAVNLGEVERQIAEWLTPAADPGLEREDYVSPPP